MSKINNLNKNIILSDYAYLKRKAKVQYTLGKYNKSLAYIKAAANIAYHLNFQYTDDELEILLTSISSKLLIAENTKHNEEKYVFYDSFGFDNRGLTEQYLNALISWNAKFLYILESETNVKYSSNILKKLKEYSNCEVIIISSKLTDAEKIEYAFKIINQFKPTKSFLHLAPWSIVGVCLFNAFPSLLKYRINLTDHAFWLGKSCTDYVIEFRNYGCNISLKYRGIAPEKILLQTFYPIQNHSVFKGFPTETSDKVILFTGGAFYKMYGEKGKFFDLVKRILNENQNAILFIAGSGNMKPMNTFIEKNNFKSRVFLLGNRNDINEVFKNIDIYLATYPLSGGLMAQYAAVNHKSIIAFTSNDLPCNFTDGIINTPPHIKLTYTNEDAFCEEASKLIRDKQYRDEKSSILTESVITENKFNVDLQKLIEKNTPYQVINMDIPTEKFFQLYLDTENNFLHSYYSILFSNLRFNIFLKPQIAVRFIISIILSYPIYLNMILNKFGNIFNPKK